MKTTLLLLTILISNLCFSQSGHFIRIYNLQNSKIAKRYLKSISDSSITIILSGKKDTKEIHYSKIGLIRLNRSFGHIVAITTLITTMSFGLLGAATAKSSTGLCFVCTPSDGLIVGSVVGALSGAIAGGIVSGAKTISVKKITTINGYFDNWQIARKQLYDILAR
jgi:hypothetical protein